MFGVEPEGPEPRVEAKPSAGQQDLGKIRGDRISLRGAVGETPHACGKCTSQCEAPWPGPHVHGAALLGNTCD